MRAGALITVILLGCATPPAGARPVPSAPIRAGGVALRVYLRPAAAGQLRAAVWLHPAGSAGLAQVEPLAPLLARHGFALVVPVEKDVRAWTSRDAAALFGEALPAAARAHGLSTAQPLLLGYSAGAQMALHLWHHAPEEWAGLLLVAGAPELTNERGAAPITFDDAWRYGGTPVLSIVGERDPAAGRWRAALDSWKKAGVPLELRQVPNADHQWCVGAFELERLDQWLNALPRPAVAR